MVKNNVRLEKLSDCILSSGDLVELANNLWWHAYKTANHKSNRLYLDFYDYLLELTSNDDTCYSIAGDGSWVPSYLLHMWEPYGTARENAAYWMCLADEIKVDYFPSAPPQITPKQIQAVLEHVETRYGFCSRILKDNPVVILLLPNRHKEHNSQYGLKVDITRPKSEIILLLNVANEDTSLEAVLLHELGHLLHTRLTGESWVTPKSFDFLQQKMYQALDGCPKREWCEYFADSFAVAALQDSSFRPNGYMSMYREDDKAAIGEYYRVLMDVVEQNPKGQLSWDELQ